MTYIDIAGVRYPATVHGRIKDQEWNDRKSKAITLEMTYDEAISVFVNDLEWSIIYQADSYVDENGETTTPEPLVYDNSEYSVSGPITDNRDGTITVKMGKLTAEEMLAILQEVL